MERRKDAVTRLELKVGIAAGVALLLLAIVIFTVGKIRLGYSGYPIDITFHFVDAINPQADVLIGGGVKIGRVESISIQGETIQVRAIINRDVKIPVGSKFQILSKGLMGDKYLNVIPLTTSREFLPPGIRVEGVEPANMDKAFQRLGQVADSVRNLLGDPEMKASIMDTLQSVQNLARRLDRITAQNEEKINRSFRDFSSSAEEVRRFSGELKQFSLKLNEVLSEKNRGNLEATLQNLQTTSGRLEKATAKIGQGKGALGVLIEDEQVGKDLKDLVKEIKEQPWKLLWK